MSYLRLWAGYVALMMSIVMMSISSFMLRYTGFEVATGDLLRYLMLATYLVYSLAYAVVKRTN